mmetsp:Transcript_69719/g.130147  ORF Transcript_69719/g.130147 Transcript_69719/m.130147 type:complete len:205 (-) Transcript_69719:46-660(-)
MGRGDSSFRARCHPRSVVLLPMHLWLWRAHSRRRLRSAECLRRARQWLITLASTGTKHPLCCHHELWELRVPQVVACHRRRGALLRNERYLQGRRRRMQGSYPLDPWGLFQQLTFAVRHQEGQLTFDRHLQADPFRLLHAHLLLQAMLGHRIHPRQRHRRARSRLAEFPAQPCNLERLDQWECPVAFLVGLLFQRKWFHGFDAP